VLDDVGEISGVIDVTVVHGARFGTPRRRVSDCRRVDAAAFQKFFRPVPCGTAHVQGGWHYYPIRARQAQRS
jgi:hypothetical protein